MLQLLLQTFLFKDIIEAEIKKIAEFSELVTYETDEEVIVEGKAEAHPDLFLLVVGQVNVGTKFSHLPNAEELDLHPIDNQMFGEVAWLLGKKRSAIVSCKGGCKFIRINGNRLYDYCQSNPAVGVVLVTRIATVLAQRVAHLTDLVRDKALYS
jgi:CRP-like cAMP-binding protein